MLCRSLDASRKQHGLGALQRRPVLGEAVHLSVTRYEHRLAALTTPERTIQRMAEADGVPNSEGQKLEAVQRALEQGSDKGKIEFTNGEAPGIRFNRRAD